MNRAFNFLFVASTLFSFGCRKQLPKTDYIRFVQNEENGLKKTFSVDHWEYVIQYKPYSYIIAMERRTNDGTYDAKKRMETLKGTAWFNISIRRSDRSISPLRYKLTSREEYDARLNYFLNRAAGDITLLYDKKDTLHPIAYEFENNYNLAPQETMVVGFRLPPGEDRPSHDLQLSFDDEVFKNGIIKAKIGANDITHIPNLID